MTLSRKEFLRLAGGGLGATMALNLLPGKSVIAAGGSFVIRPADPNARAALYDGTICVGCRACEGACKKANNLPAEKIADPTNGGTRTGLTAYTFTRIRTVQADVAGQTRPVNIKLQCMHCLHPACAEACIVGALKKTPEGPVTYDENKCIGCRYCMVACPFGIPNFEWDSPTPWIRKCTFCAGRQAQGLQPACIDICPTHALKFGTRQELLTEARQRITAEPARYVNYIYGENEVGGTSWLYLSSVQFNLLGFGPHVPDPVIINAARAMGLVPPVLLGVAATMTGIYWLTKRRALAQVKVPVEDKKGGAVK